MASRPSWKTTFDDAIEKKQEYAHRPTIAYFAVEKTVMPSIHCKVVITAPRILFILISYITHPSISLQPHQC
jgi:hypothetical protein